MDRTFKGFEDLSRHSWLNAILGLLAHASVLLGILGFFGIGPTTSAFLWATGSIGSFCFAWFSWNYYRIHTENRRLKQYAYEFHQINHHYRDTLCEIFFHHGFESGDLDDQRLLEKEKVVLERVCGKIANVFLLATRKKCFVTVYLIKDEGGQKTCFPWASSEINSNRKRNNFSLGAENTRFITALQQRAASPTHFYEADLLSLAQAGKYSDETQHWEKLYTSCIVVPIRYHRNGSTNAKDHDEVGFLVVDTMSARRLNDAEHVHLVASFADQMYNFLSMMRRKYFVKAVQHS
jgi:hypothetical protein